MKSIETERLVIRNFEIDDWQDLQELVLQREASEYAPYDQTWPTSDEEIKGVAEWFAGGDSFLAACLKSGDKLIGFIALNEDENEACKAYGLGYGFNFDYHGKGYATEACRAVLDYAFSELGAELMNSGTTAKNEPSVRLLKRLGFKKVGEHTGSFRTDDQGEPIEFLGYTFELSRDAWAALESDEVSE
jgi:[ribosomal protein S5]-alanine N-acetyltransferase